MSKPDGGSVKRNTGKKTAESAGVRKKVIPEPTRKMTGDLTTHDGDVKPDADGRLEKKARQ